MIKSQTSPTVALQAPPDIGTIEIKLLADLLHQQSGIILAEDRTDFVRVRLGKRLQHLGHNSFASYLRLLRSPSGKPELKHLVESMTTHTTGFFRETAHFDWMRQKALPQMVAEGAGKARPIVIWSAASSIGAELWSAGMVVDRYSRDHNANLNFELVGSDISTGILRRATLGVFTEDEIRGLPEDMRQLYLLRARKPIEGCTAWPLFRVVPELRTRGRFVTANLLDSGSAPRIEADIVFLRNVLIYFSPEDQARVVQTVSARIRRGGYLLTGHSEGAAQGVSGLKRLATSIYQRD